MEISKIAIFMAKQKNMKKVFYLFIISLLSISANLAPHEDIDIGPGSTLVYTVTMGEHSYDFIVNVTQLDDAIRFDYNMTNEAGTRGTVIISAEAYESARIQNNYFFGDLLELDNETTVWVSKTVFNEFKAGETTIQSHDEMETLTQLDQGTYPVSMHDETHELPVLYGETNMGNKFWILDNPEMPLILKMDLGWSIALKSIN